MNIQPVIRKFIPEDKQTVISLWERCGLVVPKNNPEEDIDLKMNFQPDLFFVAEYDGEIAGVVMAGYDGHRGWLNYLGVDPLYRKKGIARSLVQYSADRLRELGCPKLNIQIRTTNTAVKGFYYRLGFADHDVIGMQIKL